LHLKVFSIILSTGGENGTYYANPFSFFKKRFSQKYPILDSLQIPEKVYLLAEKITRERIEILDLKKKEDVGHFETEVFRGSLEVEIGFSPLERLKSACHSFAEALAHIERNFLREHPLGERFYRKPRYKAPHL